MDLGNMLVRVGVLVFSIVFHEVAHGWAAHKLGDDTAKNRGRLTLNPVPHVDPMGSIIVPLLLALTGSSIMLGWAKPVPVRVDRLDNPRDDHVKVVAAGPAGNLLLAFICAVFLGLVVLITGPTGGSASLQPGGFIYFLAMVLETGILLNVVLALFNLIPIPPLDGSWILARFLPPALGRRYANLRRYGMIPIILFLVAMHYLPLGGMFSLAIYRTYGFFIGITRSVGTLFG